MKLSSAQQTRLEKVAVDNGFDQTLPSQGDWLGYASTQVPLRLWLTVENESRFMAALSQDNVASALVDLGQRSSVPLPHGACATRAVDGIPALHRLVRRAFQLSKALPDELLNSFERTTAGMPRSTEAERLVVQRIGQNIFRAGLIEYWEGRCAISGLATVELLRASHIKAWAACLSDAERLDIFNGLLLAPQFDAAFDCGLITVNDDCTIRVSTLLPAEERKILCLDAPLRIARLTDQHRRYLTWHRSLLFRTNTAS